MQLVFFCGLINDYLFIIMFCVQLATSATTFIRCMCICASGAWVACGLAGGHVAVLDTRTARPLAAWRAHDAEVSHMHACTHACTHVCTHACMAGALSQYALAV